MVILGLSRVNKKTQNPLEIVLSVHFGLTPSHTLKPNWDDPKG